MSLQMEAKLGFPTTGRVTLSPDNCGHVHKQELFALLSIFYIAKELKDNTRPRK